nr:SPOR domain-containing protein [Pseudoteredinibacter isoporae]
MLKINIGLAAILLACLISVDLQAAQYDRVFTIQLGAYRTADARAELIEKYQQFPLYCRRNSRNAYVVYYGVFESYKDAAPHLQDLPGQDKLGAYIVKLDNVSLKPCINLESKLQSLI